MGIPTVLTAKTWGFYDVLFGGKPFEFQRPYGSYIMENVSSSHFRSVSVPADPLASIGSLQDFLYASFRFLNRLQVF